jgi:hypothetical protein
MMARLGPSSSGRARTPCAIGPGGLALLDGLIAAGLEDPSEPVEDGRSLLAVLKADPGPVGLDSVLAEVDKLRHLRALGLPTLGHWHGDFPMHLTSASWASETLRLTASARPLRFMGRRGGVGWKQVRPHTLKPPARFRNETNQGEFC